MAGKTTVHERERPNGKVIEVRTVPIDGGQLIRTYTDVTPSVAAVPEPETYAMLLAGLGLLGFASRRRNQKHAKAA